jgi:hypothetical protein
MASAAREIGQGAVDLSCRGVDGQHAITLKMQHGLEPARESSGLPLNTFASGFIPIRRLSDSPRIPKSAAK